MPLRMVITLAFFPDSQRLRSRLAGGPDWINSERYAIEAVADPAVPRTMLTGSMFQGILVERFGLKVRREMRPVTAYALTVAPRGTAPGPLRDPDCVQSQTPRPQRPRKPDCDLLKRAASESPLTLGRLLERTGQVWVEERGTDRIFNAIPITLDAFATFLDSILDRPVTNQTGLQGLFDLRLEFSVEGTVAAVDPALLAAAPPRAASIFTAFQEQLGFRLEPAQLPAEFVVIESIERLRPN